MSSFLWCHVVVSGALISLWVAVHATLSWHNVRDTDIDTHHIKDVLTFTQYESDWCIGHVCVPIDCNDKGGSTDLSNTQFPSSSSLVCTTNMNHIEYSFFSFFLNLHCISTHKNLVMLQRGT